MIARLSRIARHERLRVPVCTTEAVARDAAVSKGTLYGRIRNKDELLLAVCTRMADLTSRAFGDALAAPDQTVDERALSAVLAKHRLTFTLMRTSPHAEDLFSHKAQLAGDLFDPITVTLFPSRRIVSAMR